MGALRNARLAPRPLWLATIGSLSAAVGVGAAIATVIPSSYLATLTIAGLCTRSRVSGAEASPGTLRFAIFVPAHDEEAGITQTVESLVAQGYPEGSFQVHVVADNCTDATAHVARLAGATVHERDAPDDRGKGHALNWLYDRLDVDSFDVVVIVDADTIAEPSFLSEMELAFIRGAEAAQGFYGVRDIDESPAVAIRFAALACRHHLRPLGRSSLGASCGLYGNGMAFKAELLRDHRWSGDLIEDAEFQMYLLAAGILVTYVPDARVAAEMPSSLDAAVSQHERWEAGRAALARRFVPELVVRSIRGGSLRRHVYLDAAVDHITPPVTVIALLDATALAGGLAASMAGQRRAGLMASVVGGTASLALVGHVFAGLHLIDAPREVYRSLRAAPRLVVWKISLLKKLSRRADPVEWTRTSRNEVAP